MSVRVLTDEEAAESIRKDFESCKVGDVVQLRHLLPAADSDSIDWNINRGPLFAIVCKKFEVSELLAVSLLTREAVLGMIQGESLPNPIMVVKEMVLNLYPTK